MSYELDRQSHNSHSSAGQAFNAAFHKVVQGTMGLVFNVVLDEEKKKKSVRTEPNNLDEQLALEEAKANEGKQIMQDKIKDPNYPKDEWKKVQHNHESLEGENIEIHYWENLQTGEKKEFKFKDYK